MICLCSKVCPLLELLKFRQLLCWWMHVQKRFLFLSINSFSLSHSPFFSHRFLFLILTLFLRDEKSYHLKTLFLPFILSLSINNPLSLILIIYFIKSDHTKVNQIPWKCLCIFMIIKFIKKIQNIIYFFKCSLTYFLKMKTLKDEDY